MTERRDVLRTRKALITACYELILDPSTKQFTVNDILERANISRGTFYAHYKDIPALIDKVEDYILIDFEDLFDCAKTYPTKEECPNYIINLINIIEAHQKVLHQINRYADNVRLEHKIKVKFRDIMTETIKEKTQTRDAAFLSTCLTTIIFNAIISWKQADAKESKTELANKVTQFIFDGYKSFL